MSGGVHYTEEFRITVSGAVLEGTLLAPPEPRARPCLILVSGSGAHDRDETVCGQTPFRVLAEHFAAEGYVVVRWDDRGVGSSSGDAGAQDFAGSVADVCTVARWAAEHPAVDPSRRILLGHSEGGLVAAAAAVKVDAAAVVMLAGPAIAIEPLLHEQARILSEEAGATAAQLDHERQMNTAVFALARSDTARAVIEPLVVEVIRRHLQSWPGATAWDDALIDESARTMAEVVCAPAYRSLLQQEPADLLSRVTVPLLAVYGGRDTQVAGAANRDAFVRITAGRAGVEAHLFPEHNHLFQRARTGAIAEYAQLAAGPDAEVLVQVSSWLAQVLRTSR